MKVLILVLSALRDPWGNMMQVQRETWDTVVHPQTDTLYYCGKFTGVPPAWENVFFSPTYDESLEQISHRTLEAFEHALTLEWDFLARPHSSSYVHKGHLVEFIEEFGTENMLCGLLTEGEKPFLWGGGSYVISRDVIEKLVANKQHWNFDIMEDNSITELAQFIGIPLDRRGRMCSLNEIHGSYAVMSYGIGDNFSFTDWHDIKKAHPHWIFRCKQDLRREQDIDIMHKLHRYYG